MKVFAIIFVLCAVSFLNLAQTNKPRPKTQTAKPKATATPSKKSTAAKFRPKTTATPVKKSTAAKSKPSAAPSKPRTTAKQNSSATPPKKPDEKATWEKAVITDPRDARIAALQKFNETFPKSTRKREALTLIAFLRTDTGNEKLAASDTDGAAAVSEPLQQTRQNLSRNSCGRRRFLRSQRICIFAGHARAPSRLKKLSKAKRTGT